MPPTELELSGGEPVTQQDVELAVQRAEEARTPVEQAKATAAGMLAKLAEHRNERRKDVATNRHQRRIR
jgi:hypothetical protein